MPLYLRHGPEKDAHRFPGFPTMFAYDKAVYSVDSRRQENRTPSGPFRPDPTHELVLAAVQTHKGADGTAETGSSVLQGRNLVRFGVYFVFRFFIRDQKDIQVRDQQGIQRTTNVLAGDQRADREPKSFAFENVAMALLRACVALRRDQSRPDSGLVQNCPALFHCRFSSDQAERLSYGETAACRSVGGFGTLAVRPA